MRFENFGRMSSSFLILSVGLMFCCAAHAQTSLSYHGAFRSIEVFFGNGSFSLDSMAKKSLAQIDTSMFQRPDVHFVLNGHADPIGSETYNLKLSERRIREVVLYLNELGIDGTRIVWNAIGENQSKKALPVDYARWRKVEIRPIIMKN